MAGIQTAEETNKFNEWQQDRERARYLGIPEVSFDAFKSGARASFSPVSSPEYDIFRSLNPDFDKWYSAYSTLMSSPGGYENTAFTGQGKTLSSLAGNGQLTPFTQYLNATKGLSTQGMPSDFMGRFSAPEKAFKSYAGSSGVDYNKLMSQPLTQMAGPAQQPVQAKPLTQLTAPTTMGMKRSRGMFF